MLIRIFDLCLSTIALIALLPFLFPIIILLRFTGEGEVFYKQSRNGYQNKKFQILKFATMLKNSPNIGSGTITIKNDARILPIGKFLRKSKINELPQLLNVFKGEMSFIGPRPLTDEAFAIYDRETQILISSTIPGLSGIGSIIFRSEEDLMTESSEAKVFYANYIAPYKARLEKWYVEHRSLKLNFILIFITIFVVIFPKSNITTKILRDLPEMPPEMLQKSNGNFTR